ncbi:MAG: pseudouridine synthase [Lachnospiraceae bacterium]|nr:pseudouridine synthase [Lachnospiraceae bacterium]
MRINKFLSSKGVCSRREADRALEQGEITINGQLAQLGDQVNEGDLVTFRGSDVLDTPPFVLIAYNKPVGVVCSTKEKDNVIDAINYPERIYPIGRLDKDSEGLLLLTNDGELHNLISHARYGHEKEYEVVVNKTITSDFIKSMREGVKILDTVTRPCEIHKTSKDSFTIILTEGLNRQIRRMCEELGYRVRSLKRVRVMNIKLDGIKLGEYRDVTESELKELKKSLS